MDVRFYILFDYMNTLSPQWIIEVPLYLKSLDLLKPDAFVNSYLLNTYNLLSQAYVLAIRFGNNFQVKALQSSTNRKSNLYSKV